MRYMSRYQLIPYGRNRDHFAGSDADLVSTGSASNFYKGLIIMKLGSEYVLADEVTVVRWAVVCVK